LRHLRGENDCSGLATNWALQPCTAAIDPLHQPRVRLGRFDPPRSERVRRAQKSDTLAGRR
jgi:hypothetical protein